MEEMTAGSLFVAARSMDRRQPQPLDERRVWNAGIHEWSCAGLIGKVRTLESFHRELAEGPLVLISPLRRRPHDRAPSSDAPLLAEPPARGVGGDRRSSPIRETIATGGHQRDERPQCPRQESEEVWAQVWP